MTERLYYIDPYLQEFEATVLKQATDTIGKYVVLDRTAFYPTGGGQPSDTGMLDELAVLQVEKVDEEIRHYLAEPIVEGTKVIGKINWEQRFDHMQQHCGQHILSAAFEELFGLKTVSFHLGTEINTIDLETSELTEDLMNQVEKRANEVVFENRVIEVKWVNQEELRNYPVRKLPTVTENIRLVIIPDFDYNGCGGTHPQRTGEVGPIKLFGWEKSRGNVRLQFSCGFRAMKEFQKKQRILKEMTSLLGTSEEQAARKLDKMIVANHQLEKDLEEAADRLLRYEAQELLLKVEIVGDVEVISAPYIDRSIKELQAIAKQIVGLSDNKIIVLVTMTNQRLQLVCASGKSIEMNMNDVLKASLTLVNGKGGGKPDFAQGGGDALITPEQMIHHIKEEIKVNQH